MTAASLKHRRTWSMSPLLVALIAGAVLTGVVVWRGWISDDAFISFRYSHNIVHGYGPVYNPGEHVQAFTHPLWLLLITIGYAIYPQPLWIGVALGATFTLATFVVIGQELMRRASNGWVAALLVVVLALLFGSSEAWREFQTSGLENSLSGLLIALIAVEAFREDWRPGRLSLLASLLVLNRPDFVVLVAPLGLVALISVLRGDGGSSSPDTRSAKVTRLMFGVLPLVAWLVFSVFYYHALVPNTATAKVGIFTTSQAINAGTDYVWDWLKLEWLPAAGSLALLIAAMLRCRRPLALALLVGGGLYLAYVVYIGGDFMRGRLVLPVFETFAIVGVLALANALWLRPLLGGLACIVVIALTVGFNAARPSLDNRISKHGVVWERQFYWGFQVDHLSHNHGKVFGGWSDGRYYHLQSSFRALHEYVHTCGPVTIQAYMIGFLGYNAGPDIKVIDVLGLTDKTIARLPRSNLISPPPRPGHPEKLIPISYLASRGDVSILDGWWYGIEGKDCSMTSRALAYSGDTRMYNFKHTEGTPIP